MIRGNPVNIMDPDFFNLLKVLVYLILGTVGIVLLAGWALKRLGPRK
jgi:predicted membrane channel-forming protein YqfA (hemolysin III family)